MFGRNIQVTSELGTESSEESLGLFCSIGFPRIETVLHSSSFTISFSLLIIYSFLIFVN